MLKKTKNILIIVLLLLASYIYFTDEVVEKIVEKTKIEIRVVEKIDTIFKTKFKPSIIRYIDIVKDSLIYVDSSDVRAIKVNEYSEMFKNNNSTAELIILTDGKIYSISGKITTTDSIKTVTTVRDNYIIKNNLFLGLGAESVKSEEKFQKPDLKINLHYVLKDKWIFGVGYSPFTKSFGMNVGFKIL